jgi:hypothetical protein
MKIVENTFHGLAELAEIAKALSCESVAHLVLARSVFAPPSIVKETSARPIVNGVRRGTFNRKKVDRGEYIAPRDAKALWNIDCDVADAPGVMADDNMLPHIAFTCCFTVERDITSTQLCHIFSRQYSKHPLWFTNLANLVLVPAWLSKVTDGDTPECGALRWAARVTFGCCPACDGTGSGCSECKKPDVLHLDENAARSLVATSEKYRVPDYEKLLRAQRADRWSAAIRAGKGYSAPFLRPV